MNPSYRIVFSEPMRNAIRELPPLPKKMLRQALKELEGNPFLGEPLEHEFVGYYKLAVKKYRIIYSIVKEQKIIRIHAVGPRKTIYLDLLELLRSSQE